MIDFFLKGGFLMYPILLCSLAGIALLINKYLQYNKTLKDISGPIKDGVNSKPAILLPLLKAIENGSNEKELSVVGTRKVREIEKGLKRRQACIWQMHYFRL
jgi:biopolymer transport protein ExbB